MKRQNKLFSSQESSSCFLSSASESTAFLPSFPGILPDSTCSKFASVSLNSSRGKLFSRVGVGKVKRIDVQTVPVRLNLSQLALIGSQARLLMAQIPLLQRAFIGAIAGGLAGGFTNATLHPLDTIKTKLQTKGASAVYKGPFDVIKKVLELQGPGGFYKGLSAAIVGSTVSSSVYFGMYEFGKGVLGSVIHFPSAMVPPFAAAMGNVASSAILVPKEVIKQRLQAGASGSSLQVLLSTVKAEGLGGLYAGYSASLLRNVPSNMISFSTFEYLKSFWLSRTQRDFLDPVQSLLCGAVSGGLSATLTTPFDVAKTRMMTQARQAVMEQSSAAALSAPQIEMAAKARAMAAYSYGNVYQTVLRIYAEEGVGGLARGMGPRVLYSCLFSAIGFLSFETCRTILLRYHLAAVERRRTVEREQWC